MSNAQILILDKYKDLQKDKASEFDRKIESLMRGAQKLFWEIDEFTERDQINPNSFNIAYMARRYVELIEKKVEPRLNVLESVQAVSHIHIMGGDKQLDVNTLSQVVASAVYQSGFVKEVYSYLDGDVHVYLITLNEDDPDLTLKIFETYWELQESITGINFEFRPIPLDIFNLDLLPSDAELVRGK